MKKILIIVDMQNDFIDGALGTNEAVKIVPKAVEKIKNFEGEIVATYDTHFENYMETNEGKNLPVPHCIKGTNGWEINSEIMSVLSDKKFTKIEKITFGSDELPEVIRKITVGEEFTIELIGLCTDICVVSNALLLKANFPETEISVDKECCAGVTVESHNAALLTMKMCQIKV